MVSFGLFIYLLLFIGTCAIPAIPWNSLTWVDQTNKLSATHCGAWTGIVDGKLYAFGDKLGTSSLSIESVDVSTIGGVWNPAFTINVPTLFGANGAISGGSAVVDNKIYFGCSSSFAPIPFGPTERGQLHTYDPVTNTIVLVSKMPDAQTVEGCCMVEYNRVLYFLGGRASFSAQNQVLTYTIDTGVWETKTSLLSPRVASSCAIIPSGVGTQAEPTIVVTGGGSDNFLTLTTDTIQTYGITSDTTKILTNTLPQTLLGHNTVYLPDLNCVIGFGGQSTMLSDRTWIFDPVTATVTTTTLTLPRGVHFGAVRYDTASRTIYQLGGNVVSADEIAVVTLTIPKAPTKTPTLQPSKLPSKSPSKPPSKSPSKPPSKSPSKSPSKPPSKSPSKSPTELPTVAPTKSPTRPHWMWTAWSACTKTCGIGRKRRTRVCTTPGKCRSYGGNHKYGKYGGYTSKFNHPGYKNIQTQSCCNADCKKFGSWGRCKKYGAVCFRKRQITCTEGCSRRKLWSRKNYYNYGKGNGMFKCKPNKCISKCYEKLNCICP